MMSAADVPLTAEQRQQQASVYLHMAEYHERNAQAALDRAREYRAMAEQMQELDFAENA